MGLGRRALQAWPRGFVVLAAALLAAPAAWFAWSHLSPRLAPRSPEALANLDRNAAVLGVTINGQSRAYPLRSLLGVEVVNDEVGGQPIVVTF